jgi:hypothetical protein
MRTEVVTQFSIVVPNKPGGIASVTSVFSRQAINVHSVSFTDTLNQGVVRFVLGDPDKARRALEEAGFFAVEAQVAEVTMSNNPGSLHELADALGKAGVNIDYAYGGDNEDSTSAKVTFKFSDLKKALKIVEAL